MLRAAIPVLHVTSAATAEALYCGRLGFRLLFAYRAEETRPDPGNSLRFIRAVQASDPASDRATKP